MSEFLIDSVNRPDRSSSYEHITHLGNNRGLWKLTRIAIINRIDAGQEKFYTVDQTNGRKVYISVVRESGGKQPYVRTHADGKWLDDLLALPECDPNSRLIA